MVKRVTSICAAAAAAAALWGGTAGAVSGSQQFNVQRGGRTRTVTASGPISGTGVDIVINDQRDRFKFKGGSVLFDHQPHNLTRTFDEKTCTSTLREKGTYQLSSGTNKFRRAKGNGTYTATTKDKFKAVPGGGCAGGRPTTTFSLNASGTTTLP